MTTSVGRAATQRIDRSYSHLRVITEFMLDKKSNPESENFFRI